jgi:hypothetical protein
MVSKLLQHQTEMFLMFFFALRVDQYVIDEHHIELVQILHKVLVHEIYIVGWGFLVHPKYIIIHKTFLKMKVVVRMFHSHIFG